MNQLALGIAGGTGSGKATVARSVVERLALDEVVLLELDAYYRDLSDLPREHRDRRNDFDHPDAIEWTLFAAHLSALKEGRAVERPVYDFTRHLRTGETVRVEPRDVMVAEGILLFHLPETRELLDIKIFVDTPADLRLLRRIRRDVAERGRTFEAVAEQYVRTVRPMHQAFVEPSRRYADVIIPEGGGNPVAIDMLAARIRLMREVSAP